MATWRYVVSCSRSADDELEWAIRELHNGDGDQFGYTVNPVRPSGTSFGELRRGPQPRRISIDSNSDGTKETVGRTLGEGC